jgi:hypothetical protein
MISQATIGDIKQRGWQYILGVRMRRFKEANEEVLARAGRYDPSSTLCALFFGRPRAVIGIARGQP